MTTPAPRPTLVLRLESPSLPSREWQITDQPMGIGRLDDADIAVPDKSVSRQHARILPTSGGFDVEDLGSTNGTWLNDKAVTDRMALSNGDQLVIGDVPLRVVLRGSSVAIPTPPPPPPLPAPLPQPQSARSGGPSTVFYDLDDALAAASPSGSHEVATAWDVTPATGTNQPVIIDTRPHQSAPEPTDPPTLIAAEPTTPPPPTHDPRPTPTRDPQPDAAFEPRPTAARDPQLGPTFEPRPTPTRDPQADAAYESRPTSLPVDKAPAVEPAVASEDLSTTNLIDLADRVATALRLLKGDTALALWLFDHAGGQPAAQAFIEQSKRAEANPDNPIEQARLLDLAPTAARLLEAASMLAHALSALQSPDDKAQADAANLEPVPRA